MAESSRETWSGKLGFIIAISGSAIGLGNVWKFPYITGKYGGGAFLVAYLFSILLVGLPILLCELAIGRHTGRNPIAAFRSIQARQRVRFTRYLGWLAALISLALVTRHLYGFAALTLVAALLTFRHGFVFVGGVSLFCSVVILSYYSVIGGWILEYIWLFLTGSIDARTVAEATGTFGAFIGSTGKVALLHALFMLLVAAMLWSGIRKGIERWSKVLMPLMLLLLAAVIIRSVTLEGAGEGLRFFLYPDFSKLTINAILDALGQSFFSLSLGMAISITYGSYLHKDEDMFSSAFWVVAADTFAAVLAGFAIFPAVFAMGFAPDGGPSLIFKVLPATFQSIPGATGIVCGAMFFFALLIAALTSAAALLECNVTFLIDECRMKRRRAIVLCYVVITLLGVLSAVSITNWEHLPRLHRALCAAFGERFIPGTFFDTLDLLTTNWLLPLVGLVTVIFVGWVWKRGAAVGELRAGAEGTCDRNLFLAAVGLLRDRVYRKDETGGVTVLGLFFLTIRFVTPALLIFVFMKISGLL